MRKRAGKPRARHPDHAAFLKIRRWIKDTEAELERYFNGYIKQMMEEKEGCPKAIYKETTRNWYNDYSWDGKIVFTIPTPY